MKQNLYSKCNSYDFEKLFKSKGYAWFTKGVYNLNIVGIRSNNQHKVTNDYDDILVVEYRTGTNLKRAIFNITTEPGKYYMKNIINCKRTAILVPDPYRGSWELGKHKGQYKALVQKKPVKVYRDSNKDEIYDMNPETIDTGNFGINIHRSGEWVVAKHIDKWSAGCQVFADDNQFRAFIRLCEEQAKIYGNSFTYTLINEEDMV